MIILRHPLVALVGSTFAIMAVSAVVAPLPQARAGEHAPACLYTLPGDGTVIDNNTKLRWQQATDAKYRTWDDAKTYCASLTLAGLKWRLPNLDELWTIVAEPQGFDDFAFPNEPEYPYWTSTPIAGVTPPVSAWVIFFNFGGSNSDQVSHAGSFVRCVH